MDRAVSVVAASSSGCLEQQRRSVAVMQQLQAEECLWQEFFKDPSQWSQNWTHGARFRHLGTARELRVSSSHCPEWVQDRLECLRVAAFRGTDIKLSLRDCSRSRDLKRGKQLHSEAGYAGQLSNPFVAASLINMYASCGSMQHARRVFDSTLVRDSAIWTTLLNGYVKNGQSEVALELFDNLEGEYTDARIYVTALAACGALAARRDGDFGKSVSFNSAWVEKGKAIHSRAIRDGCLNMFVEAALVNLYARCGWMVHASAVFSSMIQPNAVVWTSLMQGHVENGQGKLALEIFDRMLEESHPDSAPTAATYVVAATACASLQNERLPEASRKWLEKGKAIHSQAVVNQCCDIPSLVNMYAKCGCMVHAAALFDSTPHRNLITWTALLQGYVENGQSEIALELFESIQQAQDGVVPDATAYVVAITACTNLASSVKTDSADVSLRNSAKWLEKGKQIHSAAIRNRFCNTFVENALVAMYARCGKMEHALSAFHSKRQHGVVSWNVLLQGLVDNGDSKAALEQLERMVARGFKKNTATFLAALKACGNLLDVEKGRALHAEIRASGLEQDEVIASYLLDFYAKCGCMEDAQKLFDAVPSNDIVLWNNMMNGYSLQGDTEHVFDLFEKLEKRNLRPDGITFCCLLHACSHAGMTDKAKQYFDAMECKFGVTREIVHYTCMVDMFARANRIEEALEMVKIMPMGPDVVTWTAILSACQRWNNPAVARLAYESLMELDPQLASPYCLLATAIQPGESSATGKFEPSNLQ